MKVYKRRDLTIIETSDAQAVVVSCDSCGSIGMKESDELRTDNFIVGKFTARVTLLEVLASGAVPVLLADMICNEMNDTGREIIAGIREELKRCGCQDIEITGSTEENFRTKMTALGMTVIGHAPVSELRFRKAKPGTKILLYGSPQVGEKVDISSNIIYEKLNFLLKSEGVLEIVPVGSKGIRYEADELASLNGLKSSLTEGAADYSASAGPATCLIALSDDYEPAKYEGYKLIGELV